MKRTISLLALLFALALPSFAQTTGFSLTAQPIALPGHQTTIAAMVSGLALTVTPNIDLRQDNVTSAGPGLTAFMGGFNYRLPVLSPKLNNVSPTLNGYRFQFYVTASAGIARTPSGQHYAFMGGGGVNYDLTGSGRWTAGVEVRYAKLPGFANSTAIVSVGPTLHF